MDDDEAIRHVRKLYEAARALASKRLGATLKPLPEPPYARRVPGGGVVTFPVDEPGAPFVAREIVRALKGAELPIGLRIEAEQEDGPRPAVVVRFEND